jgi:hypothetical protein
MNQSISWIFLVYFSISIAAIGKSSKRGSSSEFYLVRAGCQTSLRQGSITNLTRDCNPSSDLPTMLVKLSKVRFVKDHFIVYEEARAKLWLVLI